VPAPEKPASKKPFPRPGRREPPQPTDPVEALSAAKCAGVIEIVAPSGSPLASGEHVVLTLTRLAFTELPDPGNRSEIKLEISVRTGSDTGDGAESVVSQESSIYYYVENHSALNVLGSVLYDGPVRRHLSIDVEVTEVETSRMSAGDVKDLLTASLTAVGQAAGISGGAKAVADAIPSVVSSLMKLNGDDQVLKFAASLLTSDVSPAPTPTSGLRLGRYLFCKVREPGGEPLVTLELHVAKV